LIISDQNFSKLVYPVHEADRMQSLNRTIIIDYNQYPCFMLQQKKNSQTQVIKYKKIYQ